MITAMAEFLRLRLLREKNPNKAISHAGDTASEERFGPFFLPQNIERV